MTYIVYGRLGCNPCKGAKDLLTSKGKEFQYIDIMNMVPAELDAFKESFRSVPQIFHGDTHIGGLQELTNHLTTLSKET